MLSVPARRSGVEYARELGLSAGQGQHALRVPRCALR